MECVGCGSATVTERPDTGARIGLSRSRSSISVDVACARRRIDSASTSPKRARSSVGTITNCHGRKLP
jgi:hypothetical protein